MNKLKLINKLITVFALIASMATVVGAGIKVAARRSSQDIEVPEIQSPSPSPSIAPESVQNPSPTQVPSATIEATPKPTVGVQAESLQPVVSPRAVPSASSIPSGKFDDGNDEEREAEDELDKEVHKKEDHEDEDEKED